MTIIPKKKATPSPRETDLRVLEGKQQWDVEGVQNASSTPLSIALLLDTSASRRGSMAGAEGKPSFVFLRSLLRQGDQAMVVAYGPEPELLANLSGEFGPLEKAIDRAAATQPKGASAMYDSVHAVINRRLYSAGGRRWIVLTADGEDNASNVKLEEVLELAVRHRVGIFVLWISDPLQSRRYSSAGHAKRLAAETGGSLFRIERHSDFGEAFDKISQALRSQYVIKVVLGNSATPSPFRNLKVQTTESDWRVVAPKTFYLPTKPAA